MENVGDQNKKLKNSEYYGVKPFDKSFLITQATFKSEIKQHDKLVAIELFNRDSIKNQDLSIPINRLFRDSEIVYRKLEVVDKSLMEKYDLKTLPSLIFFRHGKVVANIEGYYDKQNVDKLVRKIIDIVIHC